MATSADNGAGAGADGCDPPTIATEDKLLFFNMRKSHRIVFKKKDVKFMPTRSRFSKGSLIPVMIHYYDVDPDMIMQTIQRVRTSILHADSADNPTAFVLASSDNVRKDTIEWTGQAKELPEDFLDNSTVLRTIDNLRVKIQDPNRNKPLKPVEERIWNVFSPFLDHLQGKVDRIQSQCVDLDPITDVPGLVRTICGDKPFCFRAGDWHKGSSPEENTVRFMYSAVEGVWIREYPTRPPRNSATYPTYSKHLRILPLVSKPRRLHVNMGEKPSHAAILEFMSTLNCQNPTLRNALETKKNLQPVELSPALKSTHGKAAAAGTTPPLIGRGATAKSSLSSIGPGAHPGVGSSSSTALVSGVVSGVPPPATSKTVGDVETVPNHKGGGGGGGGGKEHAAKHRDKSGGGAKADEKVKDNAGGSNTGVVSPKGKGGSPPPGHPKSESEAQEGKGGKGAAAAAAAAAEVQGKEGKAKRQKKKRRNSVGSEKTDDVEPTPEKKEKAAASAASPDSGTASGGQESKKSKKKSKKASSASGQSKHEGGLAKTQATTQAGPAVAASKAVERSAEGGGGGGGGGGGDRGVSSSGKNGSSGGQSVKPSPRLSNLSSPVHDPLSTGLLPPLKRKTLEEASRKAKGPALLSPALAAQAVPTGTSRRKRRRSGDVALKTKTLTPSLNGGAGSAGMTKPPLSVSITAPAEGTVLSVLMSPKK